MLVFYDCLIQFEQMRFMVQAWSEVNNGDNAYSYDICNW